MTIRAIWFISAIILTGLGNSALAQQTATDSSQELKLNLDGFSDTLEQAPEQPPEQATGKQLNLEQFDNQEKPAGDLELNLQQFDDKPQTADKNLQLNLDQFEKSGQSSLENNLPTDTKNTELNLEQFDNGEKHADKINPGGSAASRIDDTAQPKFRYMREFIVGGLLLLVFLFIMSKRRRRR